MGRHPCPRQDGHEERAIALLQEVLAIDQDARDALPGSVVKLVKQAVTIMKKRRR
jgi:hypothetical protein